MLEEIYKLLELPPTNLFLGAIIGVFSGYFLKRIDTNSQVRLKKVDIFLNSAQYKFYNEHFLQNIYKSYLELATPNLDIRKFFKVLGENADTLSNDNIIKLAPLISKRELKKIILYKNVLHRGFIISFLHFPIKRYNFFFKYLVKFNISRLIKLDESAQEKLIKTVVVKFHRNFFNFFINLVQFK